MSYMKNLTESRRTNANQSWERNHCLTSNTNSACCSIVVRCYNKGKHVGRLLSDILQQKIKDTQIVVMESGSTDSTIPHYKDSPY